VRVVDERRLPAFRHPPLVPAARHAPQAHKAGGQKEAPRLPRGAFACESKKALRASRKASGVVHNSL